MKRFSKEYKTYNAWLKDHTADTPYNRRIKGAYEFVSLSHKPLNLSILRGHKEGYIEVHSPDKFEQEVMIGLYKRGVNRAGVKRISKNIMNVDPDSVNGSLKGTKYKSEYRKGKPIEQYSYAHSRKENRTDPMIKTSDVRKKLNSDLDKAFFESVVIMIYGTTKDKAIMKLDKKYMDSHPHEFTYNEFELDYQSV